MRHHADEFVGRFHVQQHAGEDEDVLGLGGEGVDAQITHHEDADSVDVHAGGTGQRNLIAAQQLFGFGVAQGENGVVGPLLGLG